MKTIAQQLNIKVFPFEIKDKDGNVIYYENSKGYSWRSEYKDGNVIYYENSKGYSYKKEYKDGKQVYYEKMKGILGKKNTKMVKRSTTKIVMELFEITDQKNDLVWVKRLLLMGLIMN